MKPNDGYALITGASSGIGEQLAHYFAQDGISLILAARGKEELERVKADIAKQANIDIRIYSIDLAKPGAAQVLYDWTLSQELPVRYLVNNAGFGDNKLVLDAQLERLEDMVSLNVQTLVALSKLYAKDMATRGDGNILNIASIAGFVPGPGMAVYYATKAFVISFSQALAVELQPKGVIVTTVCPAATQSNFAHAANAEHSRVFKSRKLPSSESVAQFAYDAMQKGSLLAIWGIRNRVLARIVGLVPRRMLLSSVRKVQR